jgi:Base plate wedge protein 53
MYNLFKNFPVVYYNDNVAVNILARIKFNDLAKRTNAIFYPYTIMEGDRPDIIAANYYEDPRYSWIIYLANDIIDPVHDWPLTTNEFNNFIVKKYGSDVAATEQIKYWRVNYYEDDTILNTAGYAALPSYAKKYFAPTLGAAGNIVAYERAPLDVAVETNKVQEITVSSSASFAVGEIVTQKTSGTVTGQATVVANSNNILSVHHVLGAIAATAGSVGNLIGSTTGATSAVTNVNTISTPIPANEGSYWTYVTAIDYETELNEAKRHIKLIDRAYVDQIEKELDELL